MPKLQAALLSERLRRFAGYAGHGIQNSQIRQKCGNQPERGALTVSAIFTILLVVDLLVREVALDFNPAAGNRNITAK